MKLSYHDQLDWVWFLMKTRLDNYMTDHIGLVYAKNDIELSRPIGLGAVCDNNQTGQWRDWSYRYNIRWKWN